MGVVSQFRAASTDLLDRFRWARSMGATFGGARDLYNVLGYERELTIRNYRERYARGGIAKRIVDVFPNATWRGLMELIEDEDPKVRTPFELAWEDIEAKHQLQAKLHRVDKLSTLSTYAILLIGAPGELDTELPKGKPDQLLYFTPFIGGGGGPQQGMSSTMGFDADATIASNEEDRTNARFGLPKTYQIKRINVKSPAYSKPVHWSRVVHVAEGCLDNDVEGVPALEVVWNLLDDLEKVTGGGAEAFWLRANQGMHIDIDKDMPLADAKEEREALKEQADLYKHQMQRMIRTRGVEIATLGSDVANFDNPADAILTQIAGAKGIPKRILTGSEMGELASSQDRENWRDQVIGRQKGYAAPYIVRQLVERLIIYGYLPEPKKGIRGYDVRWTNTSIMTEEERSAGAASWSTTASPEGQVFTNAEIRDKWYEMLPLSPEDIAKIQPALPPGKDSNSLMGPDDGKDVAESDDEKKKKPLPFAPRAAQDKPRDFSSTQVQLPNGIAQKLLAYGLTIPDADLAADGREDDPHVTVKYGLHTSDVDEVQAVLADANAGEIVLTLGKTAIFTADDYDVLYIEIKSPALKSLNSSIAAGLETTDTYPKYIPHACVAYLKSGLGKKYVGDTRFEGMTAKLDELVFSDQTSEKTVIDLRAASEEQELLRVLEAAIESNNTDVLDRILGTSRALGGKNSGNFGHKGRPGFVGGSGPGDGVESLEHDLKLYHSSPNPNIPDFDAFFGNEEFVATFSPNEFGEYRSEAILPKDTLVLDLNHDSKMARELKLEIVKNAWPDDIDFQEQIRRGDTPQDDFYEAWTDKSNIVKALKKFPGIVARYQNEYLIPRSVLGRIPVQRILNARVLGGSGSGNFGHAGRPGQEGGSASGDLTGRTAADYLPSRLDGLDTRELFSDGKGNYTPQRTELHDKIIAKYLRGVTAVENPVAVILGGAPGVGKSTTVKAENIGQENTVHINPDDIRNDLPEYAKGPDGRRPPSTAFTHEEASDIGAKLLQEASNRRMNTVLDGTGDSSIEKLGGKVALMRSRGAGIEAIYVTTTIEESQRRADSRTNNPASSSFGRKVPPTAMREMHKAVSRVFPEAVRQGIFDRTRLYDSTKGNKLIASAERRKLTIHDQSLWDTFLAKGQ